MLSSGSNNSMSPRSCSDEAEIHEGFACDSVEEQEETYLEGSCYLKTKTDRFKEHWAVLNGKEIFCYRSA